MHCSPPPCVLPGRDPGICGAWGGVDPQVCARRMHKKGCGKYIKKVVTSRHSAGRDGGWRPVPESNRYGRICNPLHDHSANRPFLPIIFLILSSSNFVPFDADVQSVRLLSRYLSFCSIPKNISGIMGSVLVVTSTASFDKSLEFIILFHL